MKPLISVCAFRIWKISSCLRMPVAPPTLRSFAICVSFWMLMSLRSVMLSRFGGGGASGPGAAAGADVGFSGVAVAAGAGGSCALEAPLPLRAEWRLGLLGMTLFVEMLVGYWSVLAGVPRV